MRRFLTLLILLTMPTAAAAEVKPMDKPEPIRVLAGIPPIAWIAEQVGGDMVSVRTLLKPGSNPETWTVTAQDLQEFADAEVLIVVGLPFENRLAEKSRKLLPNTALYNIGHGLSRGTDPHVWLSGPLINALTQRMADFVAEWRPKYTHQIDARMGRLKKRITNVHLQLREELAPYARRPFYVMHAAFGHFALSYNLREVALEEEGKMMGPQTLQRFSKSAREDGVTVLYNQPTLAPELGERVAATFGAEVRILDPMMDDPLENIRAITDALIAGFGPPVPTP